MKDEITPVTVRLAHPVTYGDETITELKFTRRARFADMADMPRDGATLGDIGRVIGRLAGVDRQVIMRLDVDDVAAVMDAAAPFMGTGPTTPA